MKKSIKIFLVSVATVATIGTMTAFAKQNIMYIQDGTNIVSSSSRATAGSYLTMKNNEVKKVSVVLNAKDENLEDFEMKIEQTTGNTKIAFSKETKELIITPTKEGTESAVIVFENKKTSTKYVLPLTMNILKNTKNVTVRSSVESIGLLKDTNNITGVANIIKQVEEKKEAITELPKMELVSEDLKSKIQLKVAKVEGNKYKFEGDISNIQENVKYNIVTTLENEGIKAETRNITTKNTLGSNIKSEYSNGKFVLKKSENSLVFTKKQEQTKKLDAKIKALNLFMSDTKLEYLSGNVTVANTKGNAKIYFLGENGKKVDTWYFKNNDGSYYFDRTISGFEKNVKYNLVVEADNGKKTIVLWDKKDKIGKYNVEVANSMIQVIQKEEKKELEGKLNTFNIFLANGNLEYISGNITVSNTKEKVQVYFMGDNGKRVDTWYVKNNDGSYYFDRTIGGFAKGIKYSLVIEDEASKKIIDMWNKKEKIGKLNVDIFNGKLKVTEDVKVVDAKLNALNVFLANGKLEYLSGNIEVNDAKGNVQIYFMGDNGKKVETWNVKNKDGSYYFDRTIGGFEEGVGYSLVVEAENGKKELKVGDVTKKVGAFNVVVKDSKLSVKKEKVQEKKISGKLNSLNIFMANGNLEYLSGNIEVSDAKGNVQVYFMGDNGKKVETWYVKNKDGSYYFDRTIGGFEEGVKYSLVVEAENGKKELKVGDVTKKVGSFNVVVKDSKLSVKKEKVNDTKKDIVVTLKDLNLFMAGGKTEYLSGNINVKNAKGNVKLTFLAPAGKTAEVWLVKIDEENYYFDRTIGGFEKGVTYELELEAENGAKKVELKDRNEKVGNYNIVIENSKIVSK